MHFFAYCYLSSCFLLALQFYITASILPHNDSVREVYVVHVLFAIYSVARASNRVLVDITVNVFFFFFFFFGSLLSRYCYWPTVNDIHVSAFACRGVSVVMPCPLFLHLFPPFYAHLPKPSQKWWYCGGKGKTCRCPAVDNFFLAMHKIVIFIVFAESKSVHNFFRAFQLHRVTT